MARTIKSGSGWRVGWNPTAESYPGLVAGASWALELTAAEFHDLGRLAEQLAAAIAEMATELMPEERITCEAESGEIWVEATGFPDQYSLRFILLTGRGAEGEWPAAVVAEVQTALRSIQVF